jgi:hypothetical protein
MATRSSLFALFLLLPWSAWAGEAPDELPVLGLKKGTTLTLQKAAPLSTLEGHPAAAAELFLSGGESRRLMFSKWIPEINPKESAFLGTTVLKTQPRSNAGAFSSPAACFLLGKEVASDAATPVLPKDRILELENVKYEQVAGEFFDDQSQRLFVAKVTIDLVDPKGFATKIVCLIRRSEAEMTRFVPFTVGELKSVFSGLFSIDVLDQEVYVPEDQPKDILAPDTKGHLI